MFEFPVQVIEFPPGLGVELCPACPVIAAEGGIDVRATLDLLAKQQPGPWMQNVLVLLASLPDEDIAPDERIDLLACFERCESWAAAQKQRVLAGICRDAGQRRDPADGRRRSSGWEDTILEVSLALRWSEWMVSDRLDVAEELTTRLPRTWQALSSGRLSYPKAREIAIGSAKLSSDAQAAELERRILARAEEQTLREVRQSVQRQVMAIDPDGAEERRRSSRANRQVTRAPGEDGNAYLRAFGPAEAIAAVHNALTDGARKLKDTGQVDSVDQGRFDTLVDWAIRQLNEDALPQRGSSPVGATIVVKASTLAGEDDDPAEVSGFGPITAQAARDLLRGQPPAPGPFTKSADRFAEDYVVRDERSVPSYMRERAEEPPPDGDDALPPEDWEWTPPPEPSPSRPPTPHPFGIAWRVLNVDPATGWARRPPGVRLDYGTQRRFATPAQARYVRDRDRTCAVPTCGQFGLRLDIDHREEAARGGPTDVANLGPACPHHNRTTRNRGNWKIVPGADETATLITPQGRRYRIRPHDYLG
jgi:hypothetical protein